MRAVVAHASFCRMPCTTASRHLADAVGQQPAFVGIDGQRQLERRDGALVAVEAGADPAGDADRLVGGVVPDVEVVGVDQHNVRQFRQRKSCRRMDENEN